MCAVCQGGAAVFVQLTAKLAMRESADIAVILTAAKKILIINSFHFVSIPDPAFDPGLLKPGLEAGSLMGTKLLLWQNHH